MLRLTRPESTIDDHRVSRNVTSLLRGEIADRRSYLLGRSPSTSWHNLLKAFIGEARSCVGRARSEDLVGVLAQAGFGPVRDTQRLL